MPYKFCTIDAFTDQLFGGAQILVFPEATGLTDSQMQKIASEFNFSETVFILPPSSDAFFSKFKIFTPKTEINFAGHPTIAAAFALGHYQPSCFEQGIANFHVEEKIGPVKITLHQDKDQISLAQFTINKPPVLDNYVPPLHELAEILSCKQNDLMLDDYQPIVATCDRPYLIVPTHSEEILRNAHFQLSAWISSSATATLVPELFLFTPTKTKNDQPVYCARLLGQHIAPTEDPPIGSALPAFAGYLYLDNHIIDGKYQFVAERGITTGRHSVLQANVQKKDNIITEIQIGGQAIFASEGTLFL